METTVDERGRVLIPQQVRESTGIGIGSVVELEKRGKAVVISASRRKRLRSWRDLYARSKIKRTGKPEWPTPEEIKSIWE